MTSQLKTASIMPTLNATEPSRTAHPGFLSRTERGWPQLRSGPLGWTPGRTNRRLLWNGGRRSSSRLLHSSVDNG
jgi:hypothetical protein